jgi:hypothetical protein
MRFRNHMFESLDECFGENRAFLTEDTALKMADSAVQTNDGINLEEVTNSDKTPLIRAARQVVPGAQALRNQDFILVDDNRKYAGSCREEGFTFIYADSKKSPERATKRNIDHLGEVLVEALPASRIQPDIDRYAKDETVRSDLKAAVCKAYVAKNRHNLEIIYRAIKAGVTYRGDLDNPFLPHISNQDIVAQILSQPDSLAARIYRISMQHGDAGHDESNYGLIGACAQEAAHLSRFSRHKMSWKASPTEIAKHIARNPDSRTAKVAKALPEPVEHHSAATPFLGAGLAAANGAMHECNGFVPG